uniref:Uncharacterized protein n=1 Tax=Panagrolaimus superbus TaxID=310955 RepID=A0A914XX88_9BILA
MCNIYRFYTRIIQVAYLYNNLIVSIPALHLLTNTPICYMIIYFLQQTDRIAVLHQSPASVLIDKINLIQPPDYRTEDIQHLISPNPKYSHNSVAFLTYEFAKFYSNFDYDKIIIDISQKERRFWSKLDAENKKPIAVRCCFSGRNLAGQVSAHCLSTFQKKMKEVVESFKENKEATVFPSDLENFRSQR